MAPATNTKSTSKSVQLIIKKDNIFKPQTRSANRPQLTASDARSPAKRSKPSEPVVIKPIKASGTISPVQRPKRAEAATAKPIKRISRSAVQSIPEPKKICIRADIQSKLQAIKSKPQGIKSIPQDLQSKSQGVQSKPQCKQSEPQGIQSESQDKQSIPQDIKVEPQGIQSVLPLPVYIPIIYEPKPGETKPEEACTETDLKSHEDEPTPPLPPPPPGYLIFITTNQEKTDEFILPDKIGNQKSEGLSTTKPESYNDTNLEEHNNTNLEEHNNTNLEEHNNTKLEEHNNTNLEEHNNTNIKLPQLRVRNQCTHHEEMPELVAVDDEGLPRVGDAFKSLEEFCDKTAKHAKDWFFYHSLTESYNPEKEMSFKKNNGTLYIFTCQMNSEELSASTGSKPRVPKKCPARLTLARYRGETEYTVRNVCHHHSHKLTPAFNHHPYFYTVPEDIKQEIKDLAQFNVDQQLVHRYITHKLRGLAKDNVNQQMLKLVSRIIPYKMGVPEEIVAELVRKYYKSTPEHYVKRKSMPLEKLREMWTKTEYIKKAFDFSATSDETKAKMDRSLEIGKKSLKSAKAEQNSINVIQFTISYDEKMEHYVDQIEFVDCSNIEHETATTNITHESEDAGSDSETMDADSDEIATDIEYLDDTIYADTDDLLADLPADNDDDDQCHDPININKATKTNYEPSVTTKHMMKNVFDGYSNIVSLLQHSNNKQLPFKKVSEPKRDNETAKLTLLQHSYNNNKQAPSNEVSKPNTDKKTAKFNKSRGEYYSGMTLLSLLKRNLTKEAPYDELSCVQEELASYNQNQIKIDQETSADAKTTEPENNSTNKIISKSYIEKYTESITQSLLLNQSSDVKKKHVFQYSRCYMHGNIPEYKAEGLPQNGDVFNSKEEFLEYVAKHAKDWFFTYALTDCRATRTPEDINAISSYYMFACKFNRRRRYKEYEYKGLRVHKKRIPDNCPAGLMIKRDRGYVDFTVRQACHHHNHEMSEQLFKSIRTFPATLKMEIVDLAKLNVDLSLLRRYVKSQIDLPDLRITKMVYNNSKIGRRSNKILSPERLKELLEKVKYIKEHFGMPHKRRPPTRKMKTNNEPRKYRYLNNKKEQKNKRKIATNLTDFELNEVKEEKEEIIENNGITSKAKDKKIIEPVKVSSGSRVEARLNNLLFDQKLIQSVKEMQKITGCCNAHISTDGGVHLIQNEIPEMQDAAEYSIYQHDDNTVEQIEIDQEVHVMDENDIIPYENLGSEVALDNLTTESDQRVVYLLDIDKTGIKPGIKTVKQNMESVLTKVNVEGIHDIQSVETELYEEDIQGIESVQTEEYVEYIQDIESVQTEEYVDDIQGKVSVETDEYVAEYIEDIQGIESVQTEEYVEDIQSAETEEYVEQCNYENNDEDVYNVYEENGEDYQTMYEYTNDEDIVDKENQGLEDVHGAQSDSHKILTKRLTEVQDNMDTKNVQCKAKTLEELESEFVSQHAGKIEFLASTRGCPKVPLEEALINRYNIEFYICLGGMATCMENLATNMNITVLDLLKHVYQGKAVLKMITGKSGKQNRKTVHLTFIPLTMAFPYENKVVNGLHEYKTLCSKYSDVVVSLENTINSMSTEIKTLKEELNTANVKNERLLKLTARSMEKQRTDDGAARDKKRIKKLEEVICLLINRYKSSSSVLYV